MNRIYWKRSPAEQAAIDAAVAETSPRDMESARYVIDCIVRGSYFDREAVSPAAWRIVKLFIGDKRSRDA